MTTFANTAGFRFPTTRTLTAIAGIVTLSLTAAAMAGPRGPEFPISVAEAKNQAEARFQEQDADGSGDLSPEEFAAAAPKLHRFVHRSAHAALAARCLSPRRPPLFAAPQPPTSCLPGSIPQPFNTNPCLHVAC